MVLKLCSLFSALRAPLTQKKERKKGEKNKKESNIKGGDARLSRFLQKNTT